MTEFELVQTIEASKKTVLQAIGRHLAPAPTKKFLRCAEKGLNLRKLPPNFTVVAQALHKKHPAYAFINSL